jgi:plasmid stability protein
MSRRVSARRRKEFSEVIDTSAVAEQSVVCDQKIEHSEQPRKLVYRRLRGMENAFNGAWPKKTDIHCWYCRLPFETVPIPIVQQYDPVKDLYDVYGITCSAACSKAFLAKNNTNDARTRLMWQSKMLIDVFGWPADQPIPMANDWEALEVFGGYMSVEEWRKTRPGIKVRVKKPPFVPFHIFTETEHNAIATVDQTQDNFSQAEAADTLEEQAVMHGAAFSLKGLKRPPEDKIIRTAEQLAAAHPRHAQSEATSIFDEFLKTQKLPTEEEAAAIRAQREAERKAKRKRKRTTTNASTSASSRGKTRFVQPNEGAAAADEQQPPDEQPPAEKPASPQRSRRNVRRVPLVPPPPLDDGDNEGDAEFKVPAPPKRTRKKRESPSIKDFFSSGSS